MLREHGHFLRLKLLSLALALSKFDTSYSSLTFQASAVPFATRTTATTTEPA